MNGPVVSLSSEIGRGHPQYLDSVLLALSRLAPERQLTRYLLPEICPGPARPWWRLARAAYRLGAQGGPATSLYHWLRSPDAKPSRLQLSLLGTGLRRRFAGCGGICLVDHPLLAHILASVCRVAYVHGEVSAPRICAVPGVWRTFVPLESTASRLAAAGAARETLIITGLIIEPLLAGIASESFAARLARLARTDLPLTVGFFTSGAQPAPHNARIVAAAGSVARAGHRVIVFWGSSWLRASRGEMALRPHTASPDRIRSLWSRNRHAELERTAALFPSLDVIVAAAHERTNWALGLGLPMFALLPHFGPFAQENFDLARQHGVCLPLATPEDALSLGEALDALRRSGRLVEMARAGWGRYSVDGADNAARVVLASAGGTATPDAEQ